MPGPNPSVSSWKKELRATFTLAWPLVAAQLAGIALTATDVVMMGWLGPEELAAGSLATSVFFPLFVGGIGVVSATAPLIAQAIGAREGRSVRRTVRQGFWIAILATLLITPLVLSTGDFFRFIGQDPEIAALAETYLSTAVFMTLPAMAIIALRSLLAARGNSSVVLWISVLGIFVNAGGNYALMFGNFGLPRLELLGAGISTTIVHSIMFLAALGFVLTHRRYRRYYVLVRLWKPDWPRFFQMLRIGTPIGLTLVSEVGLFGVASIFMGLLGVPELAAHAVALQLASIAFMVPLGLSMATTVRVGLAYGANDPEAIRRAGWTSMALALGFMLIPFTLFILFPSALVGLYLNPANPENLASLTLAASYLGVAAAFQLVDGAQVIMAAALRGMSDTRTPMIIAIIGYWGVGLGTAWLYGFVLGWRGIGVWMGLAAGLAFVAIVLSARFAMRERLGLVLAK